MPGYSVPSFADWNDDHRKDLIVGEGGGGVPGKIRVYLNVGTEADPCFADYIYAQSNGKDLVFTPEGCLGCSPASLTGTRTSRMPSTKATGSTCSSGSGTGPSTSSRTAEGVC